MPMSVPHLVLDKVRLVLVSEVLNSNVLVQNVPNKSLSQDSRGNLARARTCSAFENNSIMMASPLHRGNVFSHRGSMMR